MARPPWAPTDEQRETVRQLAGHGTQHWKIAQILGVLAKHCRQELNDGALKLAPIAMQGAEKALRDGSFPRPTVTPPLIRHNALVLLEKSRFQWGRFARPAVRW